MPKYRYEGEAPCSYGSQVVNTGDIIDASALPGKRFVLVLEAPMPAEPSSTTRKPKTPIADGGGE